LAKTSLPLETQWSLFERAQLIPKEYQYQFPKPTEPRSKSTKRKQKLSQEKEKDVEVEIEKVGPSKKELATKRLEVAKQKESESFVAGIIIKMRELFNAAERR